MNAFKDFILKEIILTAILSLLAFILFQTFLKDYYLQIFWIVLSIIAIITGTLHYYTLLQVSKKDTAKFSSRFLMITGIKMMGYLVFLISYVFLFPENAKFFLISFIILYLFYTAFEVIIIVKHLKK